METSERRQAEKQVAVTISFKQLGFCNTYLKAALADLQIVNHIPTLLIMVHAIAAQKVVLRTHLIMNQVQTILVMVGMTVVIPLALIAELAADANYLASS